MNATLVDVGANHLLLRATGQKAGAATATICL
jgi:hypothetical protein